MLAKLKELSGNPLSVVYLVLAVLPFIAGFFPESNIAVVMGGFYGFCALLGGFFVIKRGESKKHFIPLVIIALISLTYYFPHQGSVYWPIAWSFPMVFSALWAFGLMRGQAAFVISMFLMSAFIHVVPALLTDMIEEIDPYYHYKWGVSIYEEGVMPEHDYKTYPLLGGISRSYMPFANPLIMAMFGMVFENVGMAYHQAAILMPALMAGLAIVAAFFLLKEIYYKKENATKAAMLGAFVLMLSLAWSTKAHATDCEDEAFGGFIMLATMYLFMAAVNRDSLKLSIVGGLLFGVFVTAWDGHRLMSLVVCGAIALYSIIGVFQNKRSWMYLKHYGLMVLIGNIMWRAVLHPGPEMGFAILVPHGIELASFTLAIIAVAFNTFMLKDFGGFLSVKKNKTIALLVAAVVIGVVVVPNVWYHFYKVGVTDVGQASVVFKTIAEQHPFASSMTEYVKKLSSVLGPGTLITLMCLLPMVYLAVRKNDFGLLLLLCWIAPMLWGLYYKSQYMFVASIPLALGASFAGLFMMKTLKDSEGFAIIPTLVVLAVMVTYTPVGYMVFDYNVNMIFYNIASYDRTGWESTLQYLGAKPDNTAVLTWWDYGHWLTAVSRKHVLIDNLQYDHWEIQDVAEFFMEETNEDDAFDILKKYQDKYREEPFTGLYENGVDLKYVAIDWTMIGKSGAMHFIASGNLTTQEDGDYGAYTICSFAPQYSQLEGRVIPQAGGTFEQERILIFACSGNRDNVGGIALHLLTDSIRAEVVDGHGQRIDWGVWSKSKDASLMGVKTFNEIIGASIQYADSIDRIPPTYRTFVYASGDFENYMLARLYLGETIDSFKEAGLADVEWGPELKHFIPDRSFEEGYVKTWRIDYSEEEIPLPEAFVPSIPDVEDTGLRNVATVGGGNLSITREGEK